MGFLVVIRVDFKLNNKSQKVNTTTTKIKETKNESTSQRRKDKNQTPHYTILYSIIFYLYHNIISSYNEKIVYRVPTTILYYNYHYYHRKRKWYCNYYNTINTVHLQK